MDNSRMPPTRPELVPDIPTGPQSQVMLEFERPIVELDRKISELKDLAQREGINVADEVANLERCLEKVERETFAHLTPWQQVQLARHPARPRTLTLARMVFDEFQPLHGDRLYGDDQAVVGGLARLEEHCVVFVGTQKGESIKDNLQRNFGMAHPEGYRKARRLMNLAEKFGRPLITFVDTPGAYPGIQAEERGQAEAIAANLETLCWLRVPVIVIITGEGGSGGALAIGIGNRVLMLEHAVFTVITPEGCAAILWKSQDSVAQAAKALRLTARELNQLDLIDAIVPEPRGGAHRKPEEMAAILRDTLRTELATLTRLSPDTLAEERFRRYRRIGSFGRG